MPASRGDNIVVIEQQGVKVAQTNMDGGNKKDMLGFNSTNNMDRVEWKKHTYITNTKYLG